MGIENPVHLLFLAAVALVVLGPKRLPELARAAGKGMREFRESLNGEGTEQEPTGAVVVQPATSAPPQQQQPQLVSGAPVVQPAAAPPAANPPSDPA